MVNTLKSKNWVKYKSYLLTGEWHIHTNYTDGHNSVDDYCRQALKLGIPLVVFSEHVRQRIDYDFNALLGEIELARSRYPELAILSGCEAKVLENGKLDVSDEILEQCEIVLMAFHSFPIDAGKYYDALRIALASPKVDIWAHPGLFLIKNDLTLSNSQIEEVANIARRNSVLIELNARYDMPPKEWLDKLKGRVGFVRGSDIHSLSDFKKGIR